MNKKSIKELVNYFIDHDIPFSDSEKIAYKLIEHAFPFGVCNNHIKHTSPISVCNNYIKIIKQLQFEKKLGDIYPALIRLQEIYKDRFE